MTLGERIRKVRGDLTQDAFAEMTGTSLKTIQRYELDQTRVDAAWLARVCQRFPQINSNWLLTGEGLAPPRVPIGSTFRPVVGNAMAGRPAIGDTVKALGMVPDTAPAGGETVPLPKVDARLSGGDGSIWDNARVIDHIGFSRAWLHQKLGHVDIGKLVIVGTIGDSMEPTIHAGDDLIVDTSVTQLLDNAVYAMRWGDVLVVKRLQKLLKGIVVISDNPAYERQTIGAEDAQDLQIIGRVRCICHVV